MNQDKQLNQRQIMSDMQVKHLSLVASEIKFGAEGSLKFSGYASVFGGVDSYGDTIVKK